MGFKRNDIRCYNACIMVPTKKEMLCIEISNRVKHIALERKIMELKKNKSSIFLTPTKFIIDFNIKLKNTAWWKKLILYSIATIIYLILTPILSFVGLTALIFGGNSLNKKIDKLSSEYEQETLDNEVSEIKSFSELWNNKGLNNFSFTAYEKRQCIFEWFRVLYGETTRLNTLANLIDSRQSSGHSTFRKENPNGHITMVPTEFLLPKEIDLQFGHYIP